MGWEVSAVQRPVSVHTVMANTPHELAHACSLELPFTWNQIFQRIYACLSMSILIQISRLVHGLTANRTELGKSLHLPQAVQIFILSYSLVLNQIKRAISREMIHNPTNFRYRTPLLIQLIDPKKAQQNSSHS